MNSFPYGHATHPQWGVAASLVLAQLRAQVAQSADALTPSLALVYITDHYAAAAQEILDFLTAELPEVTDWAGTVGVGIAVNNAEYFNEPALAVMLCDLPSDQYRVFSGVAPLGVGDAMGFEAHTALVHADPGTPDLTELIAELAGRTQTGYLFGGLTSSRSRSAQFAVGGNGNIRGQGAAGGVFEGGLSGVAFGEGVTLVSRVTQGCQPLASGTRRITGADGNLVLALDGKPALEVLLRDLKVSLDDLPTALAAVRATLVGLTNAGSDAVRRTGNFGADTRVRHIIGLDPRRGGVAIAEAVEEGEQLSFCQRNATAARADLIRVCAEIREELAPVEQPLPEPGVMPLTSSQGRVANPAAPAAARRMLGAVYVSCSGRGGPHFGAPSAELQIVRRALGDVPLVGFFAGGEIARENLYGYTGVLTVFTG
jgi:small ligand-binding sensory domain FIST